MAHWLRRLARALGRPLGRGGHPVSGGAWERVRFEPHGRFVIPRVRPPGPTYQPPPEPPEGPEERAAGPR
jgi:hypothetical protein